MEIKINEEILTKAEDILAEQEKQDRYIRICVRAGLCPQCGGPLKHVGDDAKCYQCELTF